MRPATRGTAPIRWPGACPRPDRHGRDANDQVMGGALAYGTTAGTGTFGTTAAGSGSAAGASTSFGSPAANASSFGSTAPPAAASPPPLPPLSMAATPATTDAPSSFSDSRGFDDRDFDASYWKQNFTSRAYYTPDSNYADYEPAYRYGAECRTRYAGAQVRRSRARAPRRLGRHGSRPASAGKRPRARCATPSSGPKHKFAGSGR